MRKNNSMILRYYGIFQVKKVDITWWFLFNFIHLGFKKIICYISFVGKK